MKDDDDDSEGSPLNFDDSQNRGAAASFGRNFQEDTDLFVLNN